MIRLRIDHGDEPTFRAFRDPCVVIGRSGQCDLSLPDARGLSRFHCRLLFDEGRLVVEDLGSRHRTLVNGEPVRRALLCPGDRITLGTLQLSIEGVDPDGESTAELVQTCLHCGHLFAAREGSCPRCNCEVERRGRARALGPDAIPGYRLLRRLGSGGMGIVFEAQDLSGQQDLVALKILRPHLARNATYLVRFIEETRVLTSLRDPSIVAVHGRGRAGDLHYLIMELVAGRSAREVMLSAGGRLHWTRAVQIIWEAAKALYTAHRQAGIVHGDVKPGNFLLDAAGHVKLCDFGLARVDLERGRPSRDQAVEAERRGTAAYAAPERFEPEARLTVAADIYALGVSLFQLVSGQLPFRAPTVSGLRDAHRREPIPRLTALVSDVSPAVPMLLERMLAKSPEDRYRFYPELIADLGLLLG